jgi:protein-L-isoaspartate(D-aspartate) O-methyltransferase
LKDTAKHQGLRNQLVSVLQQKDYHVTVLVYKKTPRHLFLNSSFEDYAYQDKAFPLLLVRRFRNPTVAFQSQLLEIKNIKFWK